ncbi:MAG: hypothetical protein IPM46_08885 [Flavobacteriales bacterium]|nr:hypothetical protein [Flavobacteriales bacterium]
MLRIALSVLALAVLASCVSQPPNPVAEPATEEANEQPSPVLNAADLRIWSTVDTADRFNQASIACLRRFLTQKLQTDATNDYWFLPDAERYGAVYPELLYAEYDSSGDRTIGQRCWRSSHRTDR